MKIEIGKTQIIEVFAGDENGGKQSIEVHTNEKYHFTVPRNERWTDFYFIKCDADGFWFPLFKNRLKKPTSRYFVLCGIYTDHDEVFSIGSELNNWNPPHEGKIAFIANDVPGYYDNNRGSIKLHITRIE